MLTQKWSQKESRKLKWPNDAAPTESSTADGELKMNKRKLSLLISAAAKTKHCMMKCWGCSVELSWNARDRSLADTADIILNRILLCKEMTPYILATEYGFYFVPRLIFYKALSSCVPNIAAMCMGFLLWWWPNGWDFVFCCLIRFWFMPGVTNKNWLNSTVSISERMAAGPFLLQAERRAQNTGGNGPSDSTNWASLMGQSGNRSGSSCFHVRFCGCKKWRCSIFLLGLIWYLILKNCRCSSSSQTHGTVPRLDFRSTIVIGHFSNPKMCKCSCLPSKPFRNRSRICHCNRSSVDLRELTIKGLLECIGNLQ